MKTKTKLDPNSVANQRIKDKFVSREVLCNINSLVEGHKGWENCSIYDEMENLYIPTCQNCGEIFPDANNVDHCPECGTGDENQIESQPQEVLEWWAITGWLAEKLKEKGEVIWQCGLTHVWGRCGSGQAILLDNVISEICFEMEILEGQKNSWEVE